MGRALWRYYCLRFRSWAPNVHRYVRLVSCDDLSWISFWCWSCWSLYQRRFYRGNWRHPILSNNLSTLRGFSTMSSSQLGFFRHWASWRHWTLRNQQSKWFLSSQRLRHCFPILNRTVCSWRSFCYLRFRNQSCQQMVKHWSHQLAYSQSQ